MDSESYWGREEILGYVVVHAAKVHAHHGDLGAHGKTEKASQHLFDAGVSSVKVS